MLAFGLAVVGPACGGDQNAPPAQTPANTTMTTAGYQNPPNGYPTAGNASPSAMGSENMNNPSPATTTGSMTTTSAMGGAQNVDTTGSTAGTTGTTPGLSTTGGIATTTTTTGGMAATGTSGETLTDAQIVEVTSAANRGEIEQAREALKRAQTAKVKQFAQRMLADHSQMETKGKQMNKRAGITPQDSGVSNSLKANGVTVMTTLKSQTGADFDRAYIDAQVREHQQVLDTIDNDLLPQAQSADIKAALQQARDHVADHLKMAQDIQSSLMK
jgi:putative membrane protein